MKWTQITLSDVQPLRFCGKQIGTIEQQQIAGRNDLIIHFGADHQVKLEGAVDVSEQLEYTRVFVIEGSVEDSFALFGGETVYWLTASGAIIRNYRLYRESGSEEYWTTEILNRENALFIIYEAGVLAIDETLHVLWHKRKFYNDTFAGFEGMGLKFVRDDDAEWIMQPET